MKPRSGVSTEPSAVHADLVDFISQAWGVKEVVGLSPPYRDAAPGGVPERVIYRLDDFIARCEVLPIQPDFNIMQNRWDKYLQPAPQEGS